MNLITKLPLAIILLVIFSTPARADLAVGLSAYYPLDGTANDAGSQALHGTEYNVSYAAGKVGQALKLDGSGYIRRAGLNFSAENFTVALWAYADSLPSWYRSVFALHSGGGGSGQGDQTIHFHLNSAKQNVILTTTDGQGCCYSTGTPSYVKRLSKSGIEAGKWYHLVFVREPGLQKLYVDNVLVSSTDEANVDTQFSVQNGLLEIGAPNYYYGGWTANGRDQAKWQGMIDEVYVYNRTLSESEIQQLYNGETPDFSRLVLEDGENTIGQWGVYSGTGGVNTVFDNERNSQVIETQGGALILKTQTGGAWNVSDYPIVRWSMKTNDLNTLYWEVDTTSNVTYLTYRLIGDEMQGCRRVDSAPTYVMCSLDLSLKDDTWHTVTRDLEADLQTAVPGATLTKVKYFRFRKNARLDDIRLMRRNATSFYTLSGRITQQNQGVNGVTFSSSGASCTTSDAAGNFQCSVPAGWSGSLIPEKSGYTFAPLSRVYNGVSNAVSAQNYTAIPLASDTDRPVFQARHPSIGIVQLHGTLSDYVDDHFTVIVKAKPTGIKSINYLFHANDDRPGIRLNGSNQAIFAFSPNPSLSPLPISGSTPVSISLPLNTQVELAAVWNGSQYTAYVNNAAIGSAELPSFTLGERVMIGWDGVTGREFAGDISEVRLYKKAFAPTPHTLAVTASPSTGGLVSRMPDKTIYGYDESVTLTPAAMECYEFSHWTGAAECGSEAVCTLLHMHADRSLTARFVERSYALNTKVVNLDDGTASGGSIQKTPDSAEYCRGASVTLEAEADPGYQFVRWEGSVSSGNPILVLPSIDATKSVTALFIKSIAPPPPTNPAECIAVIPADNAFGSEVTGQTGQAHTFTVMNTCEDAISVDNVAFGGSQPGEFALQANHCSGSTLAQQQTCEIRVAFAPSSEGDKTATLMVLFGTNNYLREVVMRGTGISQPPPVACIENPVETNGLSAFPDSACSYDPDGTIVRRDWQVNCTNNATQSRPDGNLTESFTFTAPGICTATLTATDNDGNSNSVVSEAFDLNYSIRPVNLSVRCHIQPGAKAAIAGFIIKGTGTKKILLRALAATSLSPGLDLRLSLYKLRNGTWDEILSNDNWAGGSRAADIAGLPVNLVPAGSMDAALLTDLEPGAYTAIATPNSDSGIGVVGVDDLDGDSPSSRLINISGRCTVEDAGGNAIAGFIVAGQGTLKTLLRGLRVNDELSGTLDPRLELVRIYPGNPVAEVLESNDNHDDHPRRTEIAALSPNLLPRDHREGVILRELAAGVYTVLMKPNGAFGVGVVGVDVLE